MSAVQTSVQQPRPNLNTESIGSATDERRELRHTTVDNWPEAQGDALIDDWWIEDEPHRSLATTATSVSDLDGKYFCIAVFV